MRREKSCMMGLFGFGKKKDVKVKVEMYGYENGKRVKLKSDKFSGEMKSAEYYQTIKKKIQPLEDKMVSFAVRSRETRKADERIAALNGVIRTYHEIQRICVGLGAEYEEYFSQMWKPDYVEKFERELKELSENRGRLIQEEQIRERESADLEKRVSQILKVSPGILQTDVYKQFNPTVQSEIQSILYFMAKDGTIVREKYGKTYRIFYNGK